MSTKARVTVAAAVLALSVSGCAPVTEQGAGPATQHSQTATPSPSPTLTESQLLAWEQMAGDDGIGPGDGEAEYAQAVLGFPLEMPAGTAFPEQTSFEFYSEGGVLGKGIGAGIVSWTWLCATETVLLDAIADDDTDRIDESFAQLEAWMALPSEVRVLEGIDAFRSVVVDPALAGDTTALESDQKSWCAQFPFEPA